MRMRRTMLAVAGILAGGVVSMNIGGFAAAQSIDVAIAFEVNATDGDAKVLISCKSSAAMKRLRVWSPNRRLILELSGNPRVPDLTQMEIEGAEPDLDAVTAAYPEGTYTFEARIGDDVQYLDAELTHTTLPAPVVTPGHHEVLEPDAAQIEWAAVDGAVGYLVEIEQGAQKQTWKFDARTHSLTIPPGSFAPGVACKLDVLTLCANGNRCVAESTFYIAPPRGAMVPNCPFTCNGTTPFFSLEPGLRLVLASAQGRRLESTVLHTPQFVEGILTRIVEERESDWSGLRRVTRRFVAICQTTQELYCFAEERESYLSGRLLASQHFASATPWILLPGEPPPLSTGRAPATIQPMRLLPMLELDYGRFANVLVVADLLGPAPAARAIRFYAEGLGLVKQDDLELIIVGFIEPEEEEDDEDEEDD
ncbi:MAG: hypothetical protein ACKVX7_05350 [Planctomycetota bacterium]